MVMPTEHEEQRELVRWFRQTYPDVRIFAIPNWEKRSNSVASRLKAEGVSAGFLTCLSHLGVCGLR